jgi:integrase/recombinase XerC
MAIEDFIKYIKFEKRFSSHTIVAYQKDLDQFSNFILEDKTSDIGLADALQIRSWLALLLEQGMSARSVQRKAASLRAYYRFLDQNGKLAKNPMIKVSLPKAQKRLPVIVSSGGIEILLDEIEFPTGFVGLRDKLILETFYCTGIRLSELVELRNIDLDLERNLIKVKGKGKKERLIPAVDSYIKSVRSYLDEKERLFGNGSGDYLFITEEGKKVYSKLVYRVVNFYLSYATTVKKRSPHVLRHTFATHMLNNGADINAIKELLGHSSLNATEIYTHNTVEKIKSVYKQAHPKA